MKDLLLAAALLILFAAGLIAWEIRSARMDRKAAGLRSANRGRGK